MAARRDDLGTLGLVLVLVPWVVLPVGAFFLFFGDGPRDGSPDPRDAALPWYLVMTGLVALVGVALAVVRGRDHRARMIVAVIFGGGWILLATRVLMSSLLR